MNINPKVSVITVSYNSEETIADTIKSVIEQKYNNIEYIVIDGGSTDNTVSIITSFYSGVTYFISEPDKGIYHAINKGISKATGDIIGLLHSDDVFADTDVIKDIVRHFNNENTNIIWGDIVFKNKKNEITRYYSGKNISMQSFNLGIMPPHPSVFIKKKCYDLYGNFNPNYSIASDYELLLRFIVINKLSYSYLARLIVKMKVGGASNKNILSIIRLNIEIYYIHRVNGVPLKWNYFIRKIPIRLKELVTRNP